MKGWPTQAPFDGILVAAAPLSLPEALVAQLAPGGRLIVPVGPEGQQQLLRLTRRESGLHREVLGAGGLRAPVARRHLGPANSAGCETAAIRNAARPGM